MKFDVMFVLGHWEVWQWQGNTCERVKTFKTQNAAIAYAQKRGSVNILK